MGEPRYGVVNVAYCNEHGLHGCREVCFACGRPAAQVQFVQLSALTTEEIAEALLASEGRHPKPFATWQVGWHQDSGSYAIYDVPEREQTLRPDPTPIGKPNWRIVDTGFKDLRAASHAIALHRARAHLVDVVDALLAAA